MCKKPTGVPCGLFVVLGRCATQKISLIRRSAKMEMTEMCTATARISGDSMVSSTVCYTNRGILEIIVRNESEINEHFYYEVRNFYSDSKLASGVIEAGKTEKYCVKITEEIHLVQAAYVILTSLSSTCSGFACLSGVIDYCDPPLYSNQVAYHHMALEISLSNHMGQLAR